MPKLDAYGIIATDLARSLEFYALLGIDVPLPADDHVEAVLPNGLRIMWDSLELVKQIKPSWEQPKGTRTSLAFLCESPAEVDQVFGKIVAAGFGASKEPWDAFWGQRYAVVIDPDGNEVHLFAWVPQA